jgi:peptidoglycan L-alanyl-D-glutamate endopeptidase CwlK
MGKTSFGRMTTAQLETVNPILKDLAYRTLDKCKVDFGVLDSGGLRTAAQQNILFKKGFSKADGYIKKSYHQSGNAVDFVPYINGAYTWADRKAFDQIHSAVTAAWEEMNISNWKLTWGGDWTSFLDLPHYQLDKK